MRVLALKRLLAQHLAAPILPEAACRGRHDLFDPPRPGEDPDTAERRMWAALDVCNRCPELRPCRRWLDGLPSNVRPHGVVAGQVRLWRRSPRPTPPKTRGGEAMSRRNSRKDRGVRALEKLIATGAADLVIAVERGELTADEAWEAWQQQRRNR